MNLLNLLADPTPIVGECYGSKLDIHQRIMLLAKLWAQLSSKDPRTKVGAAIYNESTKLLALGYNGFPHGIPDYIDLWNNRNRHTPNNKYLYVRHAEENAVDRARDMGMQADGSRLYVTHSPCAMCAKTIIQFGIKTVYYLEEYPDEDALSLFELGGVLRKQVTLEVDL